MSLGSLDVGHRQTLNKRLVKSVVNSAIAAFLAASSFAMLESKAYSGGETRTIAMSHIHSGERISVTYMENGRYVPSAMKKINYLLRDWRKNKVVTMDPRTVDLIWELHQDLGSRADVRIVCGLRTAGTNSMLRRIGRNVAKHSQHVNGKAIDFYFPDVPTKKIRNSALVRKVGGVGYYRSAGGPTGFLHVDTGSVRHWGPHISNSEMAQIMRDGKKTVGRRMRLNGGNSYEAAPDDTQSSGGGLLAAIFGKKKPRVIVEPDPVPVQETVVASQKQKAPAVEKAYTDSQDELADLAIDAAIPPPSKKPKPAPEPVVVAEVTPVPKPTPVVPKDQIAALNALADDASKAQQTQETEQQAQVADAADAALVEKGPAIPRPRLKPVEIMLMAAANMKPDRKFVRVTPVSAGPVDQAGVEQPNQLDGSLGTLIEAEGLIDEPVAKPVKKIAIAKPTKKSPIVMKPLLASAGGSDINWWPQEILNEGKVAMTNAGKDEAGEQSNSEGKGDLVVTINRDGKGDLNEVTPKLLRKSQKLSLN